MDGVEREARCDFRFTAAARANSSFSFISASFLLLTELNTGESEASVAVTPSFNIESDHHRPPLAISPLPPSLLRLALYGRTVLAAITMTVHLLDQEEPPPYGSTGDLLYQDMSKAFETASSQPAPLPVEDPTQSFWLKTSTSPEGDEGVFGPGEKLDDEVDIAIIG